LNLWAICQGFGVQTRSIILLSGLFAGAWASSAAGADPEPDTPAVHSLLFWEPLYGDFSLGADSSFAARAHLGIRIGRPLEGSRWGVIAGGEWELGFGSACFAGNPCYPFDQQGLALRVGLARAAATNQEASLNWPPDHEIYAHVGFFKGTFSGPASGAVLHGVDLGLGWTAWGWSRWLLQHVNPDAWGAPVIGWLLAPLAAFNHVEVDYDLMWAPLQSPQPLALISGNTGRLMVVVGFGF
jgi:hypothetical protein